MNNELERMWKKAFVTYFELLFQHSIGCTEGNIKNQY
jgi:hypothetical protein